MHGSPGYQRLALPRNPAPDDELLNPLGWMCCTALRRRCTLHSLSAKHLVGILFSSAKPTPRSICRDRAIIFPVHVVVGS